MGRMYNRTKAGAIWHNQDKGTFYIKLRIPGIGEREFEISVNKFKKRGDKLPDYLISLLEGVRDNTVENLTKNDDPEGY